MKFEFEGDTVIYSSDAEEYDSVYLDGSSLAAEFAEMLLGSRRVVPYMKSLGKWRVTFERLEDE